jgi:hypothetical protein
LGTYNAFLSLGEGQYLELFAPNPEAEVPLQSLIGVDGLKPHFLTFFCDADAMGLDQLVEHFQLPEYKRDERTAANLIGGRKAEECSRRNHHI